jgi:hypothetical protein
MYHNYLKKNKNNNKEDGEDIIDLTQLTNATSKKTSYICKSCDNTKLIDYSEEQLYNSFAGKCYICPSCGKIYDSSLEKLPQAPSEVRSSLGQNDNPSSELIFETIVEDRGTVSRFYDNIIFDSSRGDDAKYDLKEIPKKE